MEATQPTSSSAPDPTPRKWQVLSSRQRRVLGVLIEKAKTTPDAYPLTVNAIVSGSNQKNNREPQTSYTAEEVEQALEELRALGAVTEVQGSGRVPKYRHHAYEWLGVDKTELAIMAELLLRGEQTLGELRGRAARMEPIADTHALKPVVDGLVKKGLMIELTGPGRGQIVSHNLYKEREINELKARFAGYVPPSATSADDAPTGGLIGTAGPAVVAQAARAGATVPVGPTKDEFAELSVEVAELRAEFARLRETVGRLENKLESLIS